MRLQILPAVLCCFISHLACATEVSGRVYIYNHNGDPSQEPTPNRVEPSTLSPLAARVVLAQRAGLGDYHSADLYNGEVTDAINMYGVPTPLFRNQEQREDDGEQRVVLLVDGVTQAEADMHTSRTSLPNFKISPLPSLTSTKEMIADLIAQANSPRDAALEGRIAFYSLSGLDDVESKFNHLKQTTTADITVLMIPTKDMTDAQKSTDDRQTLPWGTYSMPGSQPQSLLRKREQEAPLEQAPGLDQDFQPIPQTLASQPPLPGILPACFTTLSQCSAQTRNCTGHGACSLKYTDTDQDPPKACYACQCTRTKHSASNGGEQTIVWGGPACQKQDVSVQFWLIALFTVALVGLVSFAVGSVWSMGEEELPSVIGAGVSGPVARR